MPHGINPKTTALRQKIIDLFRQGKTMLEVMDATGCCRSTAQNLRGLVVPSEPKLTHKDIVGILAKLIHTSETQTQIAEGYDVGPDAVGKLYRMAKKFNIPVIHRPVGRPRKQVDVVEMLKTTKLTLKGVAVEAGVSERTVHRVYDQCRKDGVPVHVRRAGRPWPKKKGN